VASGAAAASSTRKKMVFFKQVCSRGIGSRIL
jgi:hypothetical protein